MLCHQCSSCFSTIEVKEYKSLTSGATHEFRFLLRKLAEYIHSQSPSRRDLRLLGPQQLRDNLHVILVSYGVQRRPHRYAYDFWWWSGIEVLNEGFENVGGVGEIDGGYLRGGIARRLGQAKHALEHWGRETED